MESRIIELTSAAHKHGNLNLRHCGHDFFPTDVFGGSSRKAGLGTPITIKAEGIPDPIKTDIPTDKDSGRPRWIFRERKWVKQFVRTNLLTPDAKVKITREGDRTYLVTPAGAIYRQRLLFHSLRDSRAEETDGPMNSPFRYAGGKFYARKLILEHIPTHTNYCEPFAGGASVFFAKQKARRSHLNDLDKNLMMVYRIIRDRPEDLISFLEGTPATKELHTYYKNEFLPQNSIERSARWYYLNRTSYSGIMNMQNCYWGYGDKFSMHRKTGLAVSGRPRTNYRP